MMCCGKEKEKSGTIQATLPAPSNLENTNMVTPFKVEEKGTGGSTDVRDVSWAVPTTGLRTAPPGCPGHKAIRGRP